MKLILSTITAVAMLLSVASCSKSVVVNPPSKNFGDTNGVYYWKTVFRCDSAELDFLKQHNIGKLYLRMFDVVECDYATATYEKVVPNATVKIGNEEYSMMFDDEQLGKMEFVPVVYITLDALKAMQGNEDMMARYIVERVKNMCQYNALPNVKELQLDCDWTSSTEDSFFALCRAVDSYANVDLKLHWRLSSTIRLHQLSGNVPPVDNGVLMVYNTGNFDNPDAKNSIIDADDVEPYLKHLASYPLYLDIAYPTYSWQLLFRARKFAGLLSDVNLSDTALFRAYRPYCYEVKKEFTYNDKKIKPGNIIRDEIAEFENVARVKDMIEKKMEDRPHNNILYHFDIKNLSKFTDNEIDSLYSTQR